MMERAGDGSMERTRLETDVEATEKGESDSEDVLGDGRKTAGGVGGRSRVDKGALEKVGRRGRGDRDEEDVLEENPEEVG